MVANQGWMFQGRQQHGWFGTGTGPHIDPSGGDAPDPATDADALLRPANAGARMDYAAASIVAHVPRAARSRWTAADTPTTRTSLKAALAVWYGARSLSRDDFREQFLNPGTSDALTDRLRAAALATVNARSYADLNRAATLLADAAQRIGPDRWPRFLAEASRQALAAVARGDLPGITRIDVGSEVASFSVMFALILAAIYANQPPDDPPRPSPRPAPPDPLNPNTDPVPIPPPREGETPADVLMPNGQPIGVEGTDPTIREVPGDEKAARELYDRLTSVEGAEDVTSPELKDKGGQLHQNR